MDRPRGCHTEWSRSDRKGETLYDILYIWNLKWYKWTYKTERDREWTYSCRGEWIVREFGMDTYPLLYLKWITSKDLRCNTRNPTRCYVAAWMGGEFREEYLHVCVWLSPFAVHLKLSQLCSSAICVSHSVMSNSLQPMDYSQPGSSVHRIIQERILKWIVIPFSRGSSQPRDLTQVSHIASRFFTIWATRQANISD